MAGYVADNFHLSEDVEPQGESYSSLEFACSLCKRKTLVLLKAERVCIEPPLLCLACERDTKNHPLPHGTWADRQIG